MKGRIFAAILMKDVQSLFPLVILTALLFAGDVFISRLELLPVWASFRLPVLLLAAALFILSVFQLDAPSSLVDDWLCRPVPRHQMLAAKLVLILAVIYAPRLVATFIADLVLGLPLAEAIQEALLLQDSYFLVVLPTLLLTALVTQTLVQGFGVLLAIFVCVFMIPTPLVRPPGPLSPGIGEALLYSGMEWLSLVPAQVIPLVLVAVGSWLVYWRRQILAARGLLAVTVAVTLLLVLLPMWLLPWKITYAIQTMMSTPPAADTQRIALRNARSCFPATRLGDLTTDAGFNAATEESGLKLWSEEELRDAGPNTISFLTAVEARGLPLDWRVKLNFVQADWVTGGALLHSMRPARYITDNVGGSLSHAWLLPESVVKQLQEVDVQLQLTYSLTLLKPREFRVRTDGRRRKLPGLGYCSAEVDAPGNRINVDCFSAFVHPAQISGELNEIPASRVYGPVNFAPSWTQWPYGRRVKLALGSPRLARHDTITVTAWEAAGTLEKSLSTQGILGASADACPLPSADAHRFSQAHWRDSALHIVQSISVDDGVQLEVLDFGGAGLPILLLPGLGATAHSFDELAPLLARKHRVIAMTRRGTGSSSKPDFGFDTRRLGQDVLRVMDTIGLQKVLLVGHSIAGDELTLLGGHHPDRFFGLVYIDAAYDRAQGRGMPSRFRELESMLPTEPPIPPQALVNHDAMTKLLEERGHVRLPEGELIAMFRVNNPFLAGTPSIDARTQQSISAAIQAPDYQALKVPALAIYAFEDPDKPFAPWYDSNDLQLRARLAELDRILATKKRRDIELFRRSVPKGRVLELQNATHYTFQSNPQEVLLAIEEFARDLEL